MSETTVLMDTLTAQDAQLFSKRRETLLHAVNEANVCVRQHLNELSPTAYNTWWDRLVAGAKQVGTGRDNSVRIKNLDKILAHLQVLQRFLLTRSPGDWIEATQESLSCTLIELKQPGHLSFNQVWEIADQLEGELLRIGDDDYIKGVWLTWPRDRVPDAVRDRVVEQDHDLEKSETIRDYIRPFLQEDQRDLTHEYRRERALITLRRSNLSVMAATLLVLDLGCVDISSEAR